MDRGRGEVRIRTGEEEGGNRTKKRGIGLGKRARHTRL